MSTIIYNKLVRDKIPEIIKSSGQNTVCRTLDSEEYLIALDQKLSEECAEYQTDKNIEELADILEVLYAIAEARSYSKEELEQVRSEKAAERGGFAKRVYLERVVETESVHTGE